jgi:hypothetical protein
MAGRPRQGAIACWGAGVTSAGAVGAASGGAQRSQHGPRSAPGAEPWRGRRETSARPVQWRASSRAEHPPQGLHRRRRARPAHRPAQAGAEAPCLVPPAPVTQGKASPHVMARTLPCSLLRRITHVVAAHLFAGAGAHRRNLFLAQARLHVRSTPCPKDVVPLLGPLFGHFRLLHFRRQRSQRGAPARLARSGCVAHSAGAGSQQSTTASTQLWRKRHGGWATQARPAERRRGEESRCRRRGWRELH